MTSRSCTLDLTRGLAAFCVMAFHYSVKMRAMDPVWPVLPLGDIGVRAFFVISGFVITGSAMRSASRGSFAWARFVRLYPAFLTCLVLTTLWVLGLHMVTHQVSPTDWAFNLTMVPGWFGAKMVDSVYWTLAYEIAFYATVCAALPWIKGRGRCEAGIASERAGNPLVVANAPSYRRSRRPLPLTLWLCAASLPVLWWFPLVGWFLIGVMAYEVQRLGVFRARRFGNNRVNYGGRPRKGNPTILSRNNGFDRYKAVVMAVCTWAGSTSYPLYLIHCKIGFTLIIILSPIGLLPAALLTTGAMLALATLVHRLVEIPVQATLRQITLRQLVRNICPKVLPRGLFLRG